MRRVWLSGVVAGCVCLMLAFWLTADESDVSAAGKDGDLPGIFKPGQRVLRLDLDSTGISEVYEVLEVDGSWARVKFDVDAMETQLSPTTGVSWEQARKRLASMGITPEHDWWINLNAMAGVWRAFEGE